MLRKILHPNYHLGMTKMAFRRLLFHQKSNYMKVGFELQFYYVCLCMSVIAWKIIKHNNPISRNPKNSSNIYAVRNFLDNFIFVVSLFLEILLIRHIYEKFEHLRFGAGDIFHQVILICIDDSWDDLCF